LVEGKEVEAIPMEGSVEPSITSVMFEQSRHGFWLPSPPLSYDMLFKDSADGCARYDDVWGG
jgi:hypothetical protein